MGQERIGGRRADIEEERARFGQDASQFGRWLLGEAKKLGGKNHIRRQTDSEAKTPFDCYHYRIIYQTFHGMRDVLRPLSIDPTTCILPFQYDRLPTAERAVIEACPSTTLTSCSAWWGRSSVSWERLWSCRFTPS